MTDKELFIEVFNRVTGRNKSFKMLGTIVYFNDVPQFNTDGYNLAYNLHRLTNLLDDIGEFM